MPDSKDNAKMTGDTHPPEVESDLPIEEGRANAAGTTGTPRDRGKASKRGQEGLPGRDIKKAGLLKDKDAPKSDSDGETPEPDQGQGGNRS